MEVREVKQFTTRSMYRFITFSGVVDVWMMEIFEGTDSFKSSDLFVDGLA